MGLLQSAQGLLASALDLGRTRLELVSVEMQELLARLVLIMIGAVAAILLAALALGFGAVALVLAVPGEYRVALTAGLALVFLVAALVIGKRAAREAKSRPFQASLAELQRDLDELKTRPVKSFLDGVVQRRAALIERSAAQRGALVARCTEIRNASAAPAIVGASVAASLLASSPKLRDWALRGWAVYAFVRQLLGEVTATPREVLAAVPGAVQRAKTYLEANERALTVVFFTGGFFFDILTVGRIDSWFTIGQQAAYLAVITGVLLQLLLEQGTVPDTAAMPSLRRWYYEYRGAAVHFLLGAQLSLYTIFFFKSSSLLVSAGFLAFLIALLLANESRRFKALGLHVKFALLGLCYLAFAAYVVPVFVGSIGTWVFLLSMLAGSVPLLAAVWWIGRGSAERFAQVRRQVLLPLGCVLIGFLGFYLARLIPPVPLSIPFIGVYHGVEKSGENYLLAHERPWWRIWHNGDQDFRAQPGDKVYVFFRVFSPARFSDQVQMRWYWKPEGRGWALQDTIPIRIVGGREQGFRGYGVKTNYQPGAWKVQVETTDGREIGRVYFDLEARPVEPRQIFLEAD